MQALILVRHAFYNRVNKVDNGLFWEWVEITLRLGGKLQPFIASGQSVKILTSTLRRSIETGQALQRVLGGELSSHDELRGPDTALGVIKSSMDSADALVAILHDDHAYTVAKVLIEDRGKPDPEWFNLSYADAAVIDWKTCAVTIVRGEERT